jgi:hypothetical protein
MSQRRGCHSGNIRKSASSTGIELRRLLGSGSSRPRRRRPFPDVPLRHLPGAIAGALSEGRIDQLRELMAANPAVDRMQEPGLIHFGSRRPGDRCRLASPIQLPAALARNFRRAVTLSRHALPSGQLALPRKNHRSRQARCPPPSLAVHQNHLGLSSRPALQTCAPRVTGSFRRQPKRIHECRAYCEVTGCNISHCQLRARASPLLFPAYRVSAMNSSGSRSGRRWMLSTTVYRWPKMSLTYSSALGSRLMQ